MSQPTPAPAPETPMQACLSAMRVKIARIEGCGNPGIQRMAMDLRHAMIELVSLVNGLETDLGAARMCGHVPQVKAQRPVDELPIFTQKAVMLESGRALTVEEIEAMQERLRWIGDDTELGLAAEEGEP